MRARSCGNKSSKSKLVDVPKSNLRKVDKFIGYITSVARILHWGGGENDVTFDHTLYTGADPKSFGGGMSF